MSKIIFEKQTPKGLFRTYNDRPEFDFHEVNQVHGPVVLDKDYQGEADGMAVQAGNDHEKTPLAIKTADCIPILVLGKNGHAMLHAGWRGLQKKIHLADEIKNLLPEYFFIGPHICHKCYEVSDDFQTNFPDNPECFEQLTKKLFFNMEKLLISELQSAYPAANIESAGKCTLCLEEYNSYRRNKTERRNWNIYFPTSA